MSGRRQVIVAFAVLTAVFAGLLWRAEHETEKVNERVSKVESPCLKYGPKSHICQLSFEKALGTLTHPEACAVERKAGTLRAIRELAAALERIFAEPCAGARLAQERTRHNEREATAQAGDHAFEPIHTDAPPAAGGHTGSSAPPAPAHPGSHGHSAPPPSTPSQPSEPPSSNPAPETSAPTSPAAEEPAAEAQAPGLLTPTLETVCGVVSRLAHLC